MKNVINPIVNGYKEYKEKTNFCLFYRSFIKSYLKVCVFLSMLDGLNEFSPIVLIRSLHKNDRK